MLTPIERYVEGLLEKSRAWLLENLPQDQDAPPDKLVDGVSKTARFEEFLGILLQHHDESGEVHSAGWRRTSRWWPAWATISRTFTPC